MQIQLLNVPYHCGCDSPHFHCKKCGGKVIPVSLYIMLSNTYNIAMERDSCRIKFGKVPTCYNWQVPNTSNESRTRQMSCKYLYMVIHYLDVYLWCSFLCSMINWKVLHIVANCLFFIEIRWIVARAPLFLNFLCIQIIKELWVQWWDNYKHSSIITCTQMTLN